ncbi:MAG: alpha/beta fold hydrolase [Gemmatimonadetes bacterium]|nr:alpha/beta fold hydrolase [Gemmatimonadota bacterium]
MNFAFQADRRQSMDSQPTVVFLHGAGTGAWVWDRVTQALDRPAIALEVPGRTVGATPDGCASQLVEQLYRQGIGSVTVVLHSLAGVLAPALAARLSVTAVSLHLRLRCDTAGGPVVHRYPRYCQPTDIARVVRVQSRRAEAVTRHDSQRAVQRPE